MGEQNLERLVTLSRLYGSDPAWVLAGGGNTSYKDADTLWVKASGACLADIRSEGFCAMDRRALDAVWERTYPEAADEREAAVLADLLSARRPGEQKRPSVETLLHGFFPQAFVAHTHPAVVNGMTCGREGEKAVRELFPDEAVWVPFVDPGYVLARTAREAALAFRARVGRIPSVLFLQNHGLLVAADSPEDIMSISDSVAARLLGRIGRKPDRTPSAVDAAVLARAGAALAALAPPRSFALHRADPDILGFSTDEAAFGPLSSAFSPDHIVYAGHEFLYASSPEELKAAWRAYRTRNGRDPRIVVVTGAGAFSVAGSARAAQTAMALFLDACAIAVYAQSFGGALHMTREKIDFIRNWEVERYRAKAAAGGGRGK